MPAAILAIADAVVDLINSASLSMPITAYRTYVPIIDITNLGNAPDIPVVVTDSQTTPITRSGIIWEVDTIDIGVQSRLGQDVNTVDEIKVATDALMTLAAEIGDLFEGKPLAAIPGVVCTDHNFTLLYSTKMLDEEKVFRSIITLKFAFGS